MAGGGDTHDGRGLLSGLVGRPIRTISGAANEILEVRDDDVVVATGRSPTGHPVPIAWVQDALDRLHATEELQIDPSIVGYRSAFIGAVLRTLPNARVKHDPQRIVLDWSPAGWDLPVGALLSLDPPFDGRLSWPRANRSCGITAGALWMKARVWMCSPRLLGPVEAIASTAVEEFGQAGAGLRPRPFS